MDSRMNTTPSPKDRDAIDQDQFLTILSREDALARFEAALFPRLVPSEQRRLTDALGCALAEDVLAPIDVPPFNRSMSMVLRCAPPISPPPAKPRRCA
jgi:putative molybdopterin biosynthesis protein